MSNVLFTLNKFNEVYTMKKLVYRYTNSDKKHPVTVYGIGKRLSIAIITDPFNDSKLFSVSKYDTSEGYRLFTICIYKKPKGA